MFCLLAWCATTALAHPSHRARLTALLRQSTPAAAPALAGTWVFVAPARGYNDTGAGRRLRRFTGDRWYVAQLGFSSDDVSFLYGGHYTLAEGTYTETVDYATANLSVFVHRTFAYQIELNDTTLTLSDPGGGGESRNGAADGVWQRRPIAAVDRRSPPLGPEATAAVLHEVELVQQSLSTPPQNLAAAYLSNHNRLVLLAAFSSDTHVTLAFGGVPVTPSNVDQFRADYQHREDVYAAELQRRGVPQITGRYRLEIVQPCQDAHAPVTLAITQKGVAIEGRGVAPDTAYQISGVAAGGTLTLGHGDFDPDTYSYGLVGGGRRIELASFSGAGCKLALTRLQRP